MPSAVNSTYTGYSISLGVFRMGLADRIKSGTTSIDLTNEDSIHVSSFNLIGARLPPWSDPYPYNA
jgi:hypothetical protein